MFAQTSTKKARLITQTSKKTSRSEKKKKERDHLHNGLAVRELTSAEELVSALGETVASDVRTGGRTLFE